MPTTAQPKSIAVAGDLTVFIAEIGTVEMFCSNQKVFDLKPKYAPSTIAACDVIVAIGTEVSCNQQGRHRV